MLNNISGRYRQSMIRAVPVVISLIYVQPINKYYCICFTVPISCRMTFHRSPPVFDRYLLFPASHRLTG